MKRRLSPREVITKTPSNLPINKFVSNNLTKDFL